MGRELLLQKFLTTSTLLSKYTMLLKKSYFSVSNLNKAQLETLYLVHEAGALSLSDLAKKTNTTAGAVTQLIDGLINMDYIQKYQDQKDKRVFLVSFTGNGEAKFERLRREHLTHWNRLLGSIDNDEIKKVLEIQEKILRLCEPKGD